MPIPERLLDFLDSSNIAFDILDHPEAFSAQEMAHVTHIHGRAVAKVVIICDGGAHHMVLVPADCHIDLDILGDALGLAQPRLTTEDELAELFPDCEIGAMSAFGNLYGLDIAIDNRLLPEESIAFPAGNHHQSLVIHTATFMRLVRPRIVEVGVHV